VAQVVESIAQQCASASLGKRGRFRFPSVLVQPSMVVSSFRRSRAHATAYRVRIATPGQPHVGELLGPSRSKPWDLLRVELEPGERRTNVTPVQPHHAQTSRTRRHLAMTPRARASESIMAMRERKRDQLTTASAISALAWREQPHHHGPYEHFGGQLQRILPVRIKANKKRI
jgi:hypothetical protein